jgi:hypothetical protein
MLHLHVKIPLLLILIFTGLANKALAKDSSAENSGKIAYFLSAKYPGKSVKMGEINKISPSKLLKSPDGKVVIAHLKAFNDSVKVELDSILKYCETKYHVNGFKNESYLEIIRNRNDMDLVRYIVGRGPFMKDLDFFNFFLSSSIPKSEEENTTILKRYS